MAIPSKHRPTCVPFLTHFDPHRQVPRRSCRATSRQESASTRCCRCRGSRPARNSWVAQVPGSKGPTPVIWSTEVDSMFRQIQARTGRGIHGLPKVSCVPAMPDPYISCGQATPQTALQPFGGWPTHRVGGLRPSSSFLDTPRCTCLGRTWVYSNSRSAKFS
jgi:hypothetical protein